MNLGWAKNTTNNTIKHSHSVYNPINTFNKFIFRLGLYILYKQH